MKKILKLIGVFVAILAVVVISLNIDAIGGWFKSLFSEPDTTELAGPALPTDPVLRTLQKDLENGWNERDDWDEEFFVSMHKKIELIGVDRPVATQRNFNTEQAITKIYNKMFEEWGKSNCQHNVITKYNKAIAAVKKYDKNAKSNTRVHYINQVNVLYNKARKLAVDKFVPSHNYSSNGHTWRRYSDYRNEKEAEIYQLKSNYLYTNHLSNIHLLSQGLSDYKVSERFDAGRKVFSKNLSQAIKNYFENDARVWGYTYSEYNNLCGIRNRFYDEEYNDDDGALRSYVSYYYDRY